MAILYSVVGGIVAVLLGIVAAAVFNPFVGWIVGAVALVLVIVYLLYYIGLCSFN